MVVIVKSTKLYSESPPIARRVLLQHKPLEWFVLVPRDCRQVHLQLSLMVAETDMGSYE